MKVFLVNKFVYYKEVPKTTENTKMRKASSSSCKKLKHSEIKFSCFFLHRFQNCSLQFIEGHSSGVSGNGIGGKICGPKLQEVKGGCSKFHNEGLVIFKTEKILLSVGTQWMWGRNL
jgi:hypothetical protein